MDWLNIYGLILVLLMLVPNIAYAFRQKDAVNKCRSHLLNALEQVGRYGSMFLMTFNIGIAEQGFLCPILKTGWLVSSGILMAVYWLLWVFYLRTPRMTLAVLLAIVPSIIFISSGLLQRHWLLAALGCIFCVGHICVTVQNN